MHKPQIEDEEGIIARLKTGDAAAFGILFDKFAKHLYSFGKKYLKSKLDAEGLVQGVFLKVWLNREKIDPQQSFKAYLFTIAYNDICNIYRKRLNHHTFLKQVSTEFESGAETIELRTHYRDLLAKIDELIGQLPDTQKLVFLKSRKQGMSSKEIAEDLNLSSGTVDNYLSAALKFLRHNLGSENLP